LQTTIIPEPPQPGQIVRVRMRRWLVEETTPAPDVRQSALVRLACLEDDAQGEEIEVLWDKEVDPQILSGEEWQRLTERGFDPPKLFSAYLHTLRWNCLTATDPKLFQSPFRAGIQIHAYQLEPLRKALLLPRVNLFIADDVGLGKTIEAALIARELLLRKKVKEIVVASPPSILLQWKDELENRFGLTFEVMDKDYMARVRQERGYSVNPWTTHTRFLISQRLLIDETYMGPMRNWLGHLRPGALLILDEAHVAAPASGAKYAIDSKITRAIRDIAPRFEHRLFLSATPHNGHSNSFSALLEILDPQRFCRGVPVTGKGLLGEVMVRRLKEDVRAISGGFPERKVEQIDIEGVPEDTPELALSRLLEEYRKLRTERLKKETKSRQASAALLISGLQQRLLSSVEAFARTLRVHRRTVQRQWEAFQKQQSIESKRTPQMDLIAGGLDPEDERAVLSEEELQAEEEAQIEQATAATTGDLTDSKAQALFNKEQELLEEMSKIADENRTLPDERVKRLVCWIQNNMCPAAALPTEAGIASQDRGKEDSAAWSDTRLLIFTEYDDTKRYLRQQLELAIEGTDKAEQRIEVYHGPTPPVKREELKRAFNADPKKHPLRILICTDAAREGLNLQTHCSNLFHFDVPWNPSRMEQRNGRIDRKLQPKDKVYCYYFVYKQRPEDRILRALVNKTENIKKELGSLAQVVEGRLADTLHMGIHHDRLPDLEDKIQKEDLDAEYKRIAMEELEQAREVRREELKAQVDSLRNRVQDSKTWLGFDEEHFRSAISSALELMGAETLSPLSKVDTPDGPLASWQFPALDQKEGADLSWANTMDTLRAPRRRDQKFWEWRRESPVRPIVFKDPGTMEEEVVHLHLESRIVQRLLGRFASQGFIHDDLSRACVSQTRDGIPRVILLGRLCLYGPGAARLHEVIVPVAARWQEPSLRKGPLKPYAKDTEETTMKLLEEALLESNGTKVPEPVMQELQSAASTDVNDLVSRLKEKGEELAAKAEAQLAERGDKEAKAMMQILEDQRKRISKEAEKHEKAQMDLEFNDEERRQLEANKRHWKKRLEAIDQEMDTEPDRIRQVYKIKASRIEPVGLVYLWPETG